MNMRDTIFAFATPPGASGVAVLRVSGAGVPAFFASITQNKPLPEPRKATLTRIYSPADNTLIDEALALYFSAPHSFTGEEVLELHLHGSTAIRGAVMALCAGQGLRAAEAGEFIRRAFANDKMDLLQLEGFSDVLAAQTPRQLQQAWRQAGGDMGADIMEMRARIMRPLALLEAFIDFPDEEIPPHVLTEAAALRAEITKTLEGWLSGARGEKIREGFEVLIMGAPNVGKSSLINLLAGREMAIVTDEAGTTRDMIELHMDLGGFPVTIIDTAGLREITGKVEAMGVAAARKRAAQADLILALISYDTDTKQPLEMLSENNVAVILAQNKSDMAGGAQLHPSALPFSTKTGEGVDVLLATIEQKLEALSVNHASPMMTRERHRGLFLEALHELALISDDMPLEIYCEHLRRAAQCIGNITGKIHQDELLDIIFREFCIGK